MTELLVGTKKGLFVLEGDPASGFEVTARAFAGEPGGPDTPVGDDDRVDVLPAISGGAR